MMHIMTKMYIDRVVFRNAPNIQSDDHPSDKCIVLVNYILVSIPRDQFLLCKRPLENLGQD